MPASPRLPIGSRLAAQLPAALPAVCALLFAGWCGTFYFGASATGAMAAHAVLVALGAAGLARLGELGGTVEGGPGRSADGARRLDPLGLDPLGLGGGGRFLLPALLAAVGLAWWTSPVPRAGRVGLVLLPALLLAPAVFSRAWRAERDERPDCGRPRAQRRRLIATRSLSAAVAVVSVWALTSWLIGPGELPAEPLGHHLLLATWIVTLLPLALLPLGEAGHGRDFGRALAGVAGLSGVLAVLATRSLAGGMALIVEVAVALWLLRRLPAPSDRPERPAEPAPSWLERLAGGGAGRRVRRAVAAAAFVVVAVALVASWGDPSLRARGVYWRAGWAGVLERPVTGFGPGSTAWTLAAFLRPVPGINPPGEVVGELHLVPLALAYELGLPGLALAIAVAGLFAWRRLRALGIVGSTTDPAAPAAPADSALAVAGLVGLTGALVMGCATADWRVTALPLAVAVAAGSCPGGVSARRRRIVRVDRDGGGGELSAGAAGARPGPRGALSRRGGRGAGAGRPGPPGLRAGGAPEGPTPRRRARPVLPPLPVPGGPGRVAGRSGPR